MFLIFFAEPKGKVAILICKPWTIQSHEVLGSAHPGPQRCEPWAFPGKGSNPSAAVQDTHTASHKIYSATLVWNQQLVRILYQHHRNFWNKTYWKHLFLTDPFCQKMEVFSFVWRALVISSTVTLRVVHSYVWNSFASLFKKNKTQTPRCISTLVCLSALDEVQR